MDSLGLGSNYAGYRALEVLHRRKSVTVLRARREADGKAVVIKSITAGSSTPRDVTRLRYEHKILTRLAEANVENVSKPLLLLEGATTALILEDIDGASLFVHEQRGRLPLGDILTVAQAVATALVGVHRAHVVHKDVTPSNIVFNQRTGAVQLIDFGIASYLSHELQASDNPDAIAGTLHYISPEQTGRVNRLLDYRTDFYSLGVTLYQMLCGELPFQESNLVQLFHQILAMPAVPLRERVPSCPPLFSDLVAKLMAKNAEQRYQSAFGLLFDLQRCQEQWQAHERIDVFPLGSRDRNERFDIPQRLYGPTDHLQTLQQHYQACARGACHLVMIAGQSGIGKSALVTEFKSNLPYNGALFASGKQEQLRQHIPFHAMGQAVASVVRHVLLQDPETQDAWRRRIQSVLGSNGQALIDVIPAVQQLVGPQPPVPLLAAHYAELRLQNTLVRFIGALCEIECLVLFIDDLQWADAGTLHLLQLLASRGVGRGGLLIVGAYRDGEVGADHPLATMQDTLRKQGVAIDTLKVAPLSTDDVLQLVEDSTFATRNEAMGLAEQVVGKTGGNPFFVREFLKHLWQRGLLTYDPQRDAWTWDIQAIRSENVTDNVVQLMAQKLAQLPDALLELVSVAACIGTEVSLAALSAVTVRPAAQVAHDLEAVLAAGVLLPLGRSYRYAEFGSDTDEVVYKFVHDRVQQAAYERLTPERAAAHHYAIGRGLLHQDEAQRQANWIFDVVDHLNAGRSLAAAGELRQLTTLNLQAGREAKRAAAYSVACTYLNAALQLAAGVADDAAAILRRETVVELSECEAMLGHGEEALARLRDALAAGGDAFAKAELYKASAQVATFMARWEEAIGAGLAGLHGLDVPLKRNPPVFRSLPRLVRVLKAYRKQGVATYTGTLTMDRKHQLQLDLMSNVSYAGFALSAKNMMIALDVYAGETTLLHGGSLYAALSYTLFLCLITVAEAPGFGLPDFVLAQQFAQACRTMLAEYPQMKMRTFVQFLTNAYAEHVVLTAAEYQDRLKAVIINGDQSGDPVYAATARSDAAQIAFRLSLSQAEETIDENLRVPLVRGTPRLAANMLALQQALRCMQGRTASPSTFDDDSFSEARDMPRASESMYVFIKALAMYVNGEHASALALVLRGLDIDSSNSVATVSIFEFVTVLVLTRDALVNKRKDVLRPKYFKKLLHHLNQRVKAGATFKGPLLLLQAQYAAMAGDDGKALVLFGQATAALEATGYTYAVALGNECAARFCIERSLSRFAAGFCLKAMQAFLSWGAVLKVRTLTAEWADYLPLPSSHESMAMPQATYPDVSTESSELWQRQVDLPLIMRVSQALSGEVQLERLTASLLRSMRESAGADRALLLLDRHGSLIVAADSDEGSGLVGEASDRVPAAKLPKRLLNLVLRLGESVIFDASDRVSDLWQDTYITENNVTSLLCSPIVLQGKCLGLICLENKVMTGAFTKQRLEAVNLLASQAAISLQNAYLYTHLEETVEERTRQLRQANERLLKFERQTTEEQMAGGFAHEMRNALSGARYVVGFVKDQGDDSLASSLGRLTSHIATARQTLSKESLDSIEDEVDNLRITSEMLQTMVQQIDRSLNRGLAVTQKALEYAQLGKLVVSREPVSVAEVLSKLLEEFIPEFTANDIKTVSTLPPDMQVVMSAEHLSTILRNLIGNARDAVVQSGQTQGRTIHVRGTVQAEQVVLSVQDNGVGVPEHVQGRLFEPFFTTKGAQGSGLGLGVCKKLTELYGGEIHFSSTEAQGAQFDIVLPGPKAGQGGDPSD